MLTNVHAVFDKIKEISERGLEPRPFIPFEMLRAELGLNVDNLAPFLVLLKRMRLIIFDKKAMSAVKLTMLGLHSNQTP